MNQCGPCGEDFASLDAFDEHRVGFHAFTFPEGTAMDPPRYDGRRCLSVSEMTDAGWTQRGTKWQYPSDWVRRSWMWDLDPDEVEVEAA